MEVLVPLNKSNVYGRDERGLSSARAQGDEVRGDWNDPANDLG